MTIKIDFSGIKSLELLPVGIYKVMVTDAKENEGKTYPYITWEFTIIDGAYEGRKLWMNTSLSPKALFKLKEMLIALGVQAAILQSEFAFEPQDLIDRTATAVVSTEPRADTGELRNVVKKLQALQHIVKSAQIITNATKPTADSDSKQAPAAPKNIKFK